MYCMECKHDLGDCTCPDIDDRLSKLTGSHNLIFKMCQICALHYARCKCKIPIWVRSDNGEPLKDHHA